MPGAVIKADQLTGAGAGFAGVARNDLWLGHAVALSISTSGNTTYSWVLLDKPLGSTVSLSTPTSATSGFTPDLVGTYRIRLTTNGGGVGNVQTLVYRARYSSIGALANLGWAYPAFGETDLEANYSGNLRGWGEDLESILEDIRVVVTAGSGVSGPGSSTSTAIAIWNGTGGSALSDSTVKISGSTLISSSTALTVAPDSAAAGLALNLTGGAASSGAGGQLNLSSGQSTGTSDGANIVLTPTAFSTSGTDGNVKIAANASRASRLSFAQGATPGTTEPTTSVSVAAPSSVTSHTLILPGTIGSATQALTISSVSGTRATLAWAASGGGGGGTTADFIYDSAATPADNLYDDFGLLYAAASILPGAKRVYLRSTLNINADYELIDGWEFVGRDNVTNFSGVPLPQRAINLTGGSFLTTAGGYVLLDNIGLTGNGGSLYAGSISFIAGVTTFIHARNSYIQGLITPAIVVGQGGPAPSAFILLEDSIVIGASASAAGVADGYARILIRNSDVSNSFAFSGGSLWYLQHESGSTPEFAATSPWSAGANAGNYVYSGKQNNKTGIANTVTIASTQSNYAPTGWPITDILRVTASSAGLAFTGFAAPTTVSTQGRDTFIIENVGSNSFDLSHDVTSTAANRIFCPGSTARTVGVNSIATLVYDYTSSRWRVDGSTAGGGVSGPGSSTSTAIAIWNGTGGSALSDSTVKISGSTLISSSTALTIAPDSAAAGLALNLTGGAASSTTGGAVAITGGRGAISAGAGAAVTITGGQGGVTSGNGGNVAIVAGSSTGSGLNFTPGSVTITAANSIAATSPFSVGGNVTVTAGTGSTPATTLGVGGALTFTAGAGGTQAAGGAATIRGGAGGSTSGNGGGVTVQGGAALGGSSIGGGLTLTGGTSFGGGSGGAVVITGGTPGATGTGGTAQMLGGNSVGTATTGGSTIVRGGTGQTSAAGGSSTLQGGQGGSTGAGGVVIVQGGNGGTTSGTGGAVTIVGGSSGGSTGGPGSAVTITGGAAGGAAGGNGGAVSITGGLASASGAGGAITITSGASVGTNTGGALTLRSGAGGTGQPGGTITIQPGATPFTGTGGVVSIIGGSGGTTSGTGGAVTVQGGTTNSGTGGLVTVQGGTGGTADGVGGAVAIVGGSSGGSTGGPGSAVTITGGAAGGTTGGNGGAVTISGGLAAVSGFGGHVTLLARPGVGTNKSGGNITLVSGAATGSGIQGIVLIAPTTGAAVIAAAVGAQAGSGSTNPADLYVGGPPAATAPIGVSEVRRTPTAVTTTGQTLVNGSRARVDTTAGSLAALNLANPNVSAGQQVSLQKVSTDSNTVTINSPAGNINGVSGVTGVAIGGSGRQGFEIWCDGTDWWIMPYVAF